MVGWIGGWYPSRGYGFVGIDGGMQFLFLRSGLLTPVARGDSVDFWLGDNPGKEGLVAVEVRRSVESAVTGLFVGNIDREAGEEELVCALHDAGIETARTRRHRGYPYGFLYLGPDEARRLIEREVTVTLRGQKLRFEVLR